MPNVVAVVTAEPGASRNRIVETLIAEGVPDHQARKARERAVELGRVRIEAGPNSLSGASQCPVRQVRQRGLPHRVDVVRQHL